MKKSIFILTVMAAGLLMTSCLDDGDSNYSDTTFVYMDRADDGTMYGKTISSYSYSRIITSSTMQTMSPNTFKVMNYSWDEDYGTTMLSLGGQTIDADNVQLSDTPLDVDRIYLNMTELPEVEEPLSFIEIAHPLYANNKEFMGDHWIFQYAYEAREGEYANVEFHKRDDEAESENKIAIDIHLTFYGTPVGTSLERRSDAIALDMSPIRMAYEGSSEDGTKELEIEFYYHLKDFTEPQKSPIYRLTVAG